MTNVRYTLVLCLVVFVSACTSNPFSRVLPANKTAQGAIIGASSGAAVGGIAAGGAGAAVGVAAGGVAGALIGHDIESRETPMEKLRDQLVHDGVQIINQADEHMLVIPSNAIFYGQTPRIAWNSYGVLNHVATYLCSFKKITVRVAGYTNSVGTSVRNLALSKARAQNVANYLWSQNIDTRLLYVKGFGSGNPIASNKTERGRIQNDRIEITFRQLTA